MENSKLIKKLQEEIIFLQRELNSAEKGPSNPQEGVLYKKEKGNKYRKKDGDVRWKKCCRVDHCWSFPRKKGFCHLHQETCRKSFNASEMTIYYMTLVERKSLNPKCEYICQNKSVRNRKGKTCDREAQYCRDNGLFVCTNHVGVLKSRGAKIHRKSDNIAIPDGILPQD